MDPSVGSVDESIDTSTETTSKRRRQSSIWNEFNFLPVSQNNDGKSRAKCKHCSKEYIADPTSGTSNLRRHLKVCPKFDDVVSDEIKFKIDQDVYKERVALAIIRHGYTFTFAKHEANRSIHTYLNQDVRPICRNTAKAYCLKIHKRESDILKKALGEVPGRICLTCDIWTSCISEGYLCLTAHYVDKDWNLCCKILNFCHFSPPHTASLLYEKVYDKLKFWGIEKKIFTITLDNARNNDNMQELLRDQLSLHGYLHCNGAFFHVRCGAHILNLIVQEGLKLIDQSIISIREGVKYVNGSEARRIKFVECADRVGLDYSKGLWLDCPTRWNSTYEMLDRVLFYRKAFSYLAIVDSMFIWNLTDDQWSLVGKICNILKPFRDITNLFSGTRYPTSNLYFYNVLKIHLLLLEGARSEDQCIQNMTTLMLDKFEKYWDSYSAILSFAVIMDPRYKLDFVTFSYKKLFGDESVVKYECNEIKDKLYDLFASYASNNPTSEASTERRPSVDDDLMKEFDCLVNSFEDKSELDIYLNDARLSRILQFDVLSWWKDNEMKYPTLSLMARDIFTIPITTVASESAFSMGGRILNKWRASMLPENAEALITTRSWLFGFEAEVESQDSMGKDIKFSRSNQNVDLSSVEGGK